MGNKRHLHCGKFHQADVQNLDVFQMHPTTDLENKGRNAVVLEWI